MLCLWLHEAQIYPWRASPGSNDSKLAPLRSSNSRWSCRCVVFCNKTHHQEGATVNSLGFYMGNAWILIRPIRESCVLSAQGRGLAFVVCCCFVVYQARRSFFTNCKCRGSRDLPWIVNQVTRNHAVSTSFQPWESHPSSINPGETNIPCVPMSKVRLCTVLLPNVSNLFKTCTIR